MAYPYRRYRLVRDDGTSVYHSIPASADQRACRDHLMRTFSATVSIPLGPTPVLEGDTVP